MNENEQSTTNSGQEQATSVIVVADQLREQVLEYVAELTAGTTDVGGYMMSSGLPLHGSGTRCYLFDSSDGGRPGLDINCPDHD